MTDARDNLAGAVNDLAGELAALRAEVKALLAERSERRISARAAALLMGYDADYFYGHPWRIPGYGLKGTRHTVGAWRAFLDRPEAERRAEWEAIPVKERALARGLA